MFQKLHNINLDLGW